MSDFDCCTKLGAEASFEGGYCHHCNAVHVVEHALEGMIFNPGVPVSNREPVVQPTPEAPPSPPLVLFTTMAEQPFDPNDDHGPKDSANDEAESRGHGFTVAEFLNEIIELDIQLPTEQELGGPAEESNWEDMNPEEEALLNDVLTLDVKDEKERADLKGLEKEVATELLTAHEEVDPDIAAPASRVPAGQASATATNKDKVKADNHWIGDDYNDPLFQRIAAGSKRTDQEIARQCEAEEKAAEAAGKNFNFLGRMQELHKENYHTKLTKEETQRAVDKYMGDGSEAGNGMGVEAAVGEDSMSRQEKRAAERKAKKEGKGKGKGKK